MEMTATKGKSSEKANIWDRHKPEYNILRGRHFDITQAQSVLGLNNN